MDKFPELIVRSDGSGGTKVTAVMGKKYNCVEFSLRDDVPQTVFDSPWIQFMPADMRADLQALAVETVRRANAYEALERKLDETQKCLSGWQDAKEEASEEAIFYACALAEITSKITDPALKAEAAGYARAAHYKQLIKALHNRSAEMPPEQYAKEVASINSIIEKNDYTTAPAQYHREHTLGIKE